MFAAEIEVATEREGHKEQGQYRIAEGRTVPFIIVFGDVTNSSACSTTSAGTSRTRHITPSYSIGFFVYCTILIER